MEGRSGFHKLRQLRSAVADPSRVAASQVDAASASNLHLRMGYARATRYRMTAFGAVRRIFVCDCPTPVQSRVVCCLRPLLQAISICNHRAWVQRRRLPRAPAAPANNLHLRLPLARAITGCLPPAAAPASNLHLRPPRLGATYASRSRSSRAGKQSSSATAPRTASCKQLPLEGILPTGPEKSDLLCESIANCSQSHAW